MNTELQAPPGAPYLGPATQPKRAPALKAIGFDLEGLPGGDRLVRTVGLSQCGHKEIAARVAEASPHERDHDVMRLLSFIANYVMGTGARITGGQTMEYDWTMLKFRDDRPAALEIDEHADPLGGSAEAGWTAGVDRAIALRQAGDDVMRRNRLSGTADHPNRGHSAVVCCHVLDVDESATLRMDRMESVNPRDSGWAFVCTERPGDHTAVTLQHHHLAHVSQRFPFIVPYTALPIGCMVVFDREGAIVWPAGAENGLRDPDDPYVWRLDVRTT